MSTTINTWSEWLKNSRFSYMNEIQKEQTLRWLFQVRDKVLSRANLQSGSTLIDIGTGDGLLIFGAYEKLAGQAKFIASDVSPDCLEECKKKAESFGIKENFDFLLSNANDIKLPDNSVDVVFMRSVLVHILNKPEAMKEFYRILKPGGRISIFEPIIKSNTRYYELIDSNNFTDFEKLKEAEYKIMTKDNDPLTNFDAESLVKDFELAGFKDVELDLSTETSTYQATASMIEPWFNTPAGTGNQTMKERFLEYLSPEEVDDYIERLKQELDGKMITLNSFTAYIAANK